MDIGIENTDIGADFFLRRDRKYVCKARNLVNRNMQVKTEYLYRLENIYE